MAAPVALPVAGSRAVGAAAASAATRALAVAMAADVGESFNIHVDNRSSNMKKLQLQTS